MEKFNDFKDDMLLGYDNMARRAGVSQEEMTTFADIFPDFDLVLKMYSGNLIPEDVLKNNYR